MFNLSYTILTRNLVHGLQEKKEKKKKEKTTEKQKLQSGLFLSITNV